MQAVGDGLSKWHVVNETGLHTWCGRRPDDYPLVIEARDVEDDERCRSLGCRTHWPALLSAVS